MQKPTITLILAVTLAGVTGLAAAHQATEVYIPLGRSPGLSNKVTDIGQLVAVDRQTRTITLAASAGRQMVRIDDKTKVYLDRSLLEQPNRQGEFSDLQAGRKIEVKYVDPARKEVAEWVKVQLAAP